MRLFLMIIHVLSCGVLIAVILLQHRKAGGFSGIFGGGTQADMSGGQWQRLSMLNKMTVILAGVFMATSLLLVVTGSR